MKTVVLFAALCLTAVVHAQFTSLPDASIQVSSGECAGTGSIVVPTGASMEYRRLSTKARKLKGMWYGDDEDNKARLVFGSQHVPGEDRQLGFILDFDTFDLHGSTLCAARLSFAVNEVRGDNPFTTWCADASCISVDVAPSRFGFSDDQRLEDFDAFASGVPVFTSLAYDEVGGVVELALNEHLLSLGWEHLQLRVRPTRAMGASRVNLVELEEPALELQTSCPVLDETSDVAALVNAFPPAWVPPGSSPCAEEPSLCQWQSTGQLPLGCGGAQCALLPIGGAGQVDGGFSFDAAVLSEERVIVVGIRPQLRLCGLTQQVTPHPVPVGLQQPNNDHFKWNVDFHVSDAGGDLLGLDVQYGIEYRRVDGGGSPTENPFTQDVSSRLAQLAIAGVPSPFVLWQQSDNLAFNYMAAILTALDFDVDTVGVELEVSFVATRVADGAELARATTSVVTVAGEFECGGDNCVDPAAGCQPV